MNRHTDQTADVIVVGAGLGGLVAACYLARSGTSVTLLEAANTAGGLCRVFRSDGLAWNTSLYSLRGCQPGGAFFRILEETGLLNALEFYHSEESFRVFIDGRMFPFTTRVEDMFDSAAQFTGGGPDGLRTLVGRILDFNPVRDYASLTRKTFAEMANESGVAGTLLAAVSAPLFVSLGLPPSRASAYFAALKYQLLLKEGVSYPRGGAERFVGAFVDAFHSAGGRLRLGKRARKMQPHTESGIRIECDDGASFIGRHAVINADLSCALSSISEMLPEPIYNKTVHLRAGLSARLLFMSTGRETLRRTGLEESPQVVHLKHPYLDELYERIRTGPPDASAEIAGISSPVFWERPSKCAEHQLPVTAFFPAQYREQSAEEDHEINALIKARAPVIGTMTLHGTLSPGDLHRLTGNLEGSFIGWEMGPERYGAHRIRQKLPMRGLYAAGHWTDPGPSLLNVALSGKKAAENILFQIVRQRT